MTTAPGQPGPAAPGVSAATVAAWQASGIACLAAAARLARDLAGQPPGAPVASSAVLAPRYGVGTSTINLAKMVLAGHGLLTRARRQYFLARPGPPPAQPLAAGPHPSRAGRPRGPR